MNQRRKETLLKVSDSTQKKRGGGIKVLFLRAERGLRDLNYGKGGKWWADKSHANKKRKAHGKKSWEGEKGGARQVSKRKNKKKGYIREKAQFLFHPWLGSGIVLRGDKDEVLNGTKIGEKKTITLPLRLKNDLPERPARGCVDIKRSRTFVVKDQTIV